MSEAQEQPIPTKPEIFPSEEVNSEKSQKPIGEDKAIGKKSLEKERKKISKGKIARALLSAAALTSVMESTMFIPGDTSEQQRYPAIVRELSQQDLEQRVETLYQIQIVSPKEMPEIELKIEDNKTEKLKTLGWTRGDIGRLMMSLDKLPPHFYLPAPSLYQVNLPPPSTNPFNWPKEFVENQEQQFYEQFLEQTKKNLGENFSISREDFDKSVKLGYFAHQLGVYPAEFLLVDATKSQRSENWAAKCVCLGHLGTNTQSKIPFDHRVLKNESEQYRSSVVAHELTHRITNPDDRFFVDNLLESHPFEISDMKDFLKPNIERAREHLGQQDVFSLDYGSKNNLEFLAVGSEFYLQGEGKFREVYGVFIGEEKAEKFYAHMRDKMFRGTEYREYKKIKK